MSDSGLRVTVLRAEEVTTLAPPSEGQLNKIVKQKSTDKSGSSKVYICVQNSVGSYEWVQMASSG